MTKIKPAKERHLIARKQREKIIAELKSSTLFAQELERIEQELEAVAQEGKFRLLTFVPYQPPEEDSISLGELIKQALKERGYCVYYSTIGGEGKEKISIGFYDVIQSNPKCAKDSSAKKQLL